MIVRWNSALHKIKHKLLGAYRVLLCDEVEIAPSFSLQGWHLTRVNAVGIDHDLALLCLSKKFRQDYRGYCSATQQITQHVSRPDWGQLIGITYQQEVSVWRQCL